ncbi:hypothetical protein ASZ90_018353 [hydrocarbon metagenome]|uniref:histidine kinase n=1 Tax=hydrocarbon metagenome TaxID=938273 RepID=A0A0W8E6I9_9ZZZZ
MLDQQLLHSCIDNLPHGILIYHNDRLIYINQRMIDLLVYDHHELETLALNDIIDIDRSDELTENDSKYEQVFIINNYGDKIPCYSSRVDINAGSEQILIIIENIRTDSVQKQLAYMYSLIQDSAQCIIGTDLQGTIVSWNHAATDVYGYTSEDVIGRNISIIMPPDIRFSLLNRIINGETVPKQRTYAWTKQGILVDIELSISPIRDEQAKIDGISFFSRDISLEKLSEKKIFYQSRLLEAVNDSIVGADFDGKITYWNQGSERMFGWNAQEMLGKSYSTLFVEEDFDDLFYNIQQVDPAQWESVKRVNTSEGGKKYVRMSINTIYDESGQSDFLVIVFTDISEIIESRLRAEEAVRFKSEFMANISHEIRTPMSSVIGYAELLDENKFNAKERQYLRGIKQNANQLLDLINDFLDLSKIEANSMLLNEVSFDVRDLIYASLKVFEPIVKKKKLKVNINIDENVPDKLRGDRVRIRQVYNNLLSNAVKFTKRGEISILVDIPVTNSSQYEIPLSISVIDSGIGVPIDKIADIFTPFTQADSSTTTEYGGTGLGLAISKRLVELMNGSISVESIPGQGSKFEVILPLKYADSQEEVLDLRDNSFISRRKVVLVSDNSVLISQFNAILTGSEYLLVIVGYNKKLETAINFYQPHAVIVDMDNMSEYQKSSILEINNLPDMDKTLLLVYSNCMSEAEVHRYGCTGLIGTPLETSRLIKLLDARQRESVALEEDSLKHPVLILDSDELNLKLLSTTLQNSEFEAYTVTTYLETDHLLEDMKIVILIIDMEMVDSNLDWFDNITNDRRFDLKLIGLKKNDFQYHDKIKIYLNRPYTTQSLLSAINKCVILNDFGSDTINA